MAEHGSYLTVLYKGENTFKNAELELIIMISDLQPFNFSFKRQEFQ